MGFGNATKYEITHIKKGGFLNVRDVPFKEKSVVVGKIAFNVSNISVKECMELPTNSEWCYINAPRGASHIEGWVSSHYLKEMAETSLSSNEHIQNFLHNFYMAEEENYLDKLQVFYFFPMQKYLWRKNVSLLALRNYKVQEYKLWPKRQLHLTYWKILKRKETYIDVQTTVRWSFQAGEEYENGKDIQKLRLVPTGNTFKVSALKNFSHVVFPKPIIIEEQNVSTEVALSELPIATEPLVAEKHKFYIKAGSFFSDISPLYLAKIKKNGFPYFIQQKKQGSRTVRRLFIGPFNTMLKAKEALPVVRKKINEYAYIQSKIG